MGGRRAPAHIGAPPMTQPEAVAPDQWGEEGFTVDDLAQEIRRVDGNHDKGAGSLAEALMPFITAARQGRGGYEAKRSEPQNHPHPGRGEGGALPCPFCASEATATDARDGSFFVACDGVHGVLLRGYATKERAIAAWNRRAPTTYGKGERGAVARIIDPEAFASTADEPRIVQVRAGTRIREAEAKADAILQALQPIGGRRG